MQKPGSFPVKPKNNAISDSPQVEELLKNLEFHKSIQNISKRINSAEDIKEIIVEVKEEIRKLFNISILNIYILDKLKKEVYSMHIENSAIQEIHLPVNNETVVGYVANNRKTVLISDAYNEAEFKKYSEHLSFDRTLDKKTNSVTGQIIAMPIMHERSVMGVLEVMNKKGGNKTDDYHQIFLDEISNVLGIALYNQERILKQRRDSKFDYLIRHGLLTEAELEKAMEEMRDQKERIENILIRKFGIPKDAVGKALEEYHNCHFITFNDKLPIPGDLLRTLKKPYLKREVWVPLGRVAGKIHVIVDDPSNLIKKDAIEGLLKTKLIKYDVALADDINKYIDRFFSSPEDDSSIADILGKLETDEEEIVEEEEGGEIITESHSVIMQLVNKIINDAYNRRASDIHIEPNTDTKNVEVRLRVDGECSLYQTLPYNYRAALISRIKIMSNLDITVKRIPQDGKIKFKRAGDNGQEIELRVATVPTQGGVEDVVMRILAKGKTMPLEVMGLSKRNYSELLKISEQPYGMILVVGPTGSGKTTTLHAALKNINTPGRKIWTAEDPVEITQHGLRQGQVQPKIGFDFAMAMRAFLRADPDVIMVGEMRDYETAKTGVEASLTGHLVLSTLHTNSAPETIIRLLDMGIDPLNFADALLGILAQRLVRTLCKKCKEAYHPSKDEYEEMVEAYGKEYFAQLNLTYNNDLTLYRPKGCDDCDRTGYKGRMGIHELLIATDNIKRLVQKRDTAENIRKTAIAEGMTTLLQDGIVKAIQGHTDLKQVRRVCIK